jgi:bacterial surface protein 26-residue repeat
MSRVVTTFIRCMAFIFSYDDEWEDADMERYIGEEDVEDITLGELDVFPDLEEYMEEEEICEEEKINKRKWWKKMTTVIEPLIYNFNQDISSWDTSSVRDMTCMFLNAASFNQDISHWDTRNVQRMYSMFKGATKFNQNISNWDTNKVRCMDNMFTDAECFMYNPKDWWTIDKRCSTIDWLTGTAYEKRMQQRAALLNARWAK